MLNGSKQESDAPFRRYVAAQNNARFLFGSDVSAALAELRKHIADAIAFADVPPISAPSHLFRWQLLFRRISDMKLNQPANVMWIPHVPPPGTIAGGSTRHFDSVEHRPAPSIDTWRAG
jgi:hypothetical protein